MRKRSFILLEILIACSLLALCAAPLMSRPVFLYRSQMKALQNLELERLADLSFAEVKEMLLKNQIPWKKLPTEKKPKAEYPLPAIDLQIPHCEPSPMERKAIFTLQKEKLGIKGDLFLLLDVEIWFGPGDPPPKRKKNAPPRFHYRTIVKKVAVG